jgi:hypothetical protein
VVWGGDSVFGQVLTIFLETLNSSSLASLASQLNKKEKGKQGVKVEGFLTSILPDFPSILPSLPNEIRPTQHPVGLNPADTTS